MVSKEEKLRRLKEKTGDIEERKPKKKSKRKERKKVVGTSLDSRRCPIDESGGMSVYEEKQVDIYIDKKTKELTSYCQGEVLKHYDEIPRKRR